MSNNKDNRPVYIYEPQEQQRFDREAQSMWNSQKIRDKIKTEKRWGKFYHGSRNRGYLLSCVTMGAALVQQYYNPQKYPESSSDAAAMSLAFIATLITCGALYFGREYKKAGDEFDRRAKVLEERLNQVV